MLGKIAWKVGNKCEHNLLFSCLWIFTAKVENTGKIGQNWCGNWETSRNNANNWAKTFFRFRKRTGALATYLLCPSHCSSPLQRNENCRLLSPAATLRPTLVDIVLATKRLAKPAMSPPWFFASFTRLQVTSHYYTIIALAVSMYWVLSSVRLWRVAKSRQRPNLATIFSRRSMNLSRARRGLKFNQDSCIGSLTESYCVVIKPPG